MHGVFRSAWAGLCLVIAMMLPAGAASATGTDAWRAFDAPLFEHVAVKDGLPHGTVTSIVQDRSGIIWLGTFGGLVRYDGYRMQVFRQDALNPRQLPDNYVRAIAPLADGRLLIGTNAGGLVFFDPRRMRFDRVPVGVRGAGRQHQRHHKADARLYATINSAHR